MMLQGHIFNFNRKEFSVFLTMVEYITRPLGVNMNLNYRTISETYNGISDIIQIIDKFIHIKKFLIISLTLNSKKKFSAVSVNKVCFLTKKREIYILLSRTAV